MLKKMIIVLVIYRKPLILNQFSYADRSSVPATEISAVLDEHMLKINLAESFHRVEV